MRPYSIEDSTQKIFHRSTSQVYVYKELIASFEKRTDLQGCTFFPTISNYEAK